MSSAFVVVTSRDGVSVPPWNTTGNPESNGLAVFTPATPKTFMSKLSVALMLTLILSPASGEFEIAYHSNTCASYADTLVLYLKVQESPNVSEMVVATVTLE